MRQPRRPQISRSGYQSEQLRASRVTSIDRINPICGRGCAQAETGIDVGIMPVWETCAGSAGRCFRFLILSIRTRNWVRRWRVVGLVRKALDMVVAGRLAIRPWRSLRTHRLGAGRAEPCSDFLRRQGRACMAAAGTVQGHASVGLVRSIGHRINPHSTLEKLPVPVARLPTSSCAIGRPRKSIERLRHRLRLPMVSQSWLICSTLENPDSYKIYIKYKPL